MKVTKAIKEYYDCKSRELMVLLKADKDAFKKFKKEFKETVQKYPEDFPESFQEIE